MVAWIRLLADLKDLRWVVPAHHEAPVATSATELTALADRIEAGEWAPDHGAWETLAGIDKTLVRLGLVPGETHQNPRPLP